jgi:hypothetical protein
MRQGIQESGLFGESALRFGDEQVIAVVASA